jgi:hypothetical protein
VADDRETLDDNESLVELNAAAFAAEAHEPVDSWADVLHRSLADDFRLRRAIGEMEDRERMITRLSRSKPLTREPLGDPDIAVLADTALVCSRVRVGSGTFDNAKLFERTPDGWRCVYWRVTHAG